MAFTGDVMVPSQINGWDSFHDPRLNKGMAFTNTERHMLGIHGLIAAGYRSQKDQARTFLAKIRSFAYPLSKYLYLTDLREMNERLFFKVMEENVEEFMPVMYTPTVGEACLAFGFMFRISRGLYITKHDKGHILQVLENWPENNVRAICVTDGSRILGLGDLGAFGMGIPVGKLALYTALAGVKPHKLLPITLDIGTNNEKIRKDPLYIGLREPRMEHEKFRTFLDEFVEAVVNRFGMRCLIQFEDFTNENAFYFLNKYRGTYCTFNDDIQGTASVVLAGLLASEKVTGKKLNEQESIVFFGAGSANLGCANLIVELLSQRGVTPEQAYSRIYMMDVDGLITKSRQNLDPDRAKYAKDHAAEKSLLKVIQEVKPPILIGASTKGGAFTPEILKILAAAHKRPVVFALSNPTKLSEVTNQVAYDSTEGRVIFCSGSPMPPVKYGGKTYHTGQGNNAYIFPGLSLAIISVGIRIVTDQCFIIASQTLADMVTQAELDEGRLFPKLSLIRKVSLEIATNLAKYAYKSKVASVFPEPKDKKAFIKSTMYKCEYEQAVPTPWKVPT